MTVQNCDDKKAAEKKNVGAKMHVQMLGKMMWVVQMCVLGRDQQRCDGRKEKSRK